MVVEALLERLAGEKLDELFVPVGLPVGEPLPVQAELVQGASRWPATRAHAVASLVPLAMVVFPDRLPSRPTAPPGTRLDLLLHGAGSGRLSGPLGRLALMVERELVLAGERLWLGSVTFAEDAARGVRARLAGRAALEWRAWRSKSPMRVAPATTLALSALYLQPRPVHLVACREGASWDLFPMDLVGDPGGGRVSLALRKSSPANPVLGRTRRVALAPARLAHLPLAYRQGKSHPLLGPGEELGLPLVESPELGMRVPADAPGVRELEIEETLDLGSHTLFLARVIGEQAAGTGPVEPFEPGLALHHVQAGLQRRANLGQRAAAV